MTLVFIGFSKRAMTVSRMISTCRNILLLLPDYIPTFFAAEKIKSPGEGVVDADERQRWGSYALYLNKEGESGFELFRSTAMASDAPATFTCCFCNEKFSENAQFWAHMSAGNCEAKSDLLPPPPPLTVQVNNSHLNEAPTQPAAPP
ncbi:unnamed protein product, partial [Dibothriocephalus latus]